MSKTYDYCTVCVCLLDSLYMQAFVRLCRGGMAVYCTVHYICALVAASAFALLCVLGSDCIEGKNGQFGGLLV